MPPRRSDERGEHEHGRDHHRLPHLRDMFSTDAMRDVWSDENRTAKYVEIERALAIVQARLGIIPQEAADEIVRHCSIDKIDLARLRAADRADRLPRSSGSSRRSTRCAATSWASTCTGARPRRTSPTPRPCCRSARRSRWSKADLAAIADALADLARDHRDTPMIGRSNLQQAMPVTFGYKMAGILAAVERHRDRLAQLEAARAGGRVRRRVGHAGLAGDTAPWRRRPA